MTTTDVGRDSTDRPHPSVSDVFRRDVVQPLAAHDREQWTDQGIGDVDRQRYWTREWHDLEVERVWRRCGRWRAGRKISLGWGIMSYTTSPRIR